MSEEKITVEGLTAKQRAKAVKQDNDSALDLLEKELSQETLSEEESPASETEEEVVETETQPDEEDVDGEESATEDTEDVEDDTTDSEDDVQQLSARAQKRFRTLSQEKKELTLRNEQLERQAKAKQLQPVDVLAPDIDISERTEVTHEQYLEDVKKQSRSIVTGTVKDELRKKEDSERFAKMLDDYRDDFEQIEEKYPELNPDSSQYNIGLDELIGDSYNLVKEKGGRLKDVAKRIVDVSRSASKKQVQTKVDRVAKQASAQAISTETQDDSDGTSDIMKRLDAIDPRHDTIEDLDRLEKDLP